MSDIPRTPVAVTKATYLKLKRRADREGITIHELIDRLINAALDEEAQTS